MRRTRKICECGVKAVARGLCMKHYDKQRYIANPRQKKCGVLKCIVESCENLYCHNGYCSMHYHRLRKAGTVEMERIKRSEPERRAAKFWSLVGVRGDDDCWLWTLGGTKEGYGKWRWPIDGQPDMRSTHRIAYLIHSGKNPGDLMVLHKCDNPPCCNPKHLFLGTADDNMKDKIAKGRHTYGDKSTRKKLSFAIASEIRTRATAMRDAGVQAVWAPLGREYKVTPAVIRQIYLGTIWKPEHHEQI